MSEGKSERSDTYGKARSAFDGLSMDERASFLVESVVAMMAEGVGQAGKVVSSVLDDLAEKLEDLSREDQDEPAAAEPEPEKAAKTSSRRKKASGAKKASGGRKPRASSEG